MKPIKCCNKEPVIWKGCMVNNIEECCRDCIEKIFCSVCDRTVYGCDEDVINDWNKGVNDER